MRKQNLLRKQYLPLLILLFLTIQINAQNKNYDWSIGLAPTILSYSALLEGKLSNPYEYRFGTSVSFSRYLNNNFDLAIEGTRAQVQYPVNADKRIYEDRLLYDANFAIRYKFDNGYILREGFVVGPFLKFGIGGNQVADVDGFNYFLPVGLGLNISLGKNMSLNVQSSVKYDLNNSTSNSYAQHSLGLMVHFGKAGRKRLAATRVREQKRRYARIRKYRANQRLAKYEKAQKRLKKLQRAGLTNRETVAQNVEEDIQPPTSNEPDIEAELAQLEESTARLEEPIIPEPKHSRKESLVDTETELRKMIEQEETYASEPIIPQPPARRTVEENPINVQIGDNKPPIMKPREANDIQPNTRLADIMEPINTSTRPRPVATNTLNLPEEEQAYCENSVDALTTLGKQVVFDKDRYRVRSKTHKSLKKIIKILNRCEGFSYVIVAHTDKDGDADYNRKLSAKRAEAVKDYLSEHGVKRSRLLTAAYGESLADGTKEADKASNRTISFKINKTQVR